MSQLKRLSKQAELVRERREIAFRPERSLFREVAKISKKKGLSMNRVVNDLVKEGIKKGVNTLARI